MVVRKTSLHGLNANVAIISKIMILGFVFYCIAYADSATQTFSTIASSIIDYAGWFYILTVSGVLIFLLYLMVSRFGGVKLGAVDEEPEFNFTSWIAMLFAGGMGIGLIFWSVSEPMLLYANNPFSQGMTTQSAQAAMRLTFFHWGLHPWSVFVIVALSLAYFSYRRGLPLTLRSTLYPLIGKRIYGPIGDVVDILVVTITAFGIAQSLGLGVIQMNSGLHDVFGVGQNAGVQLLLVVLITALALASVMSGVGRGIRRLSELNMLLSLALVVLMMLFGPTRYILNTLLQTTGKYMNQLPSMSLWSATNHASQWQNQWTTFFWPWWMSWAPFVGMFIARISRGRTVRELVAGALIIPTAINFIWISIFGGSALFHELQMLGSYDDFSNALGSLVPFTGGEILHATQQSVPSAVFTMYDQVVPGSISAILSFLTVALLGSYFITSADSGTLVLCILDAEGNPEPPQFIRVIWGVLIGGIATGLVCAGGLQAIKSASIIAGLPIALLIVVISLTLFSDMKAHYQPESGALPEAESAVHGRA